MKTNSLFQRPRFKRYLAVAIAFSGCLLGGVLDAASSLVAGAPILVPDSHGKFDFIEMDPDSSRLLASHAGNKSLDVFDAATGKLVKHCPTGSAQGVAVDSKDGKYYVSVSAERKLVVIDSKTLETTSETDLSGPADVLAFNPKNHCAYVCHDDGSEVWAVDVEASKVRATVAIPKDPEGIVYDPPSDLLYLNIKTSHMLVVIDPAQNKVIKTWPIAPVESPHGLAIDSESHRLFVAGGNGKLVMLDSESGRVIAFADIAPKVDQIALDKQTKRIYCASGTGVLSVLQVKDQSLESLGDVPTHKGAHSVAVDPKSHAVWIAYADGETTYIQSFNPVSQ
jgi:DNA-binding beta-propeller fold protein YncE